MTARRQWALVALAAVAVGVFLVTVLFIFGGDGLKPGTMFNGAFACDNVEQTHQEMAARGVEFPTAPHKAHWGTVAMFKDPDGNTFHIGYDSLGRVASYALGAQSPHEVIEYDWTDSYPKTTTWTFDGALGAVTAKPASITTSAIPT